MDNFLIAGGKMKGKVKGFMPFDDSDLYKIIEGASNSLISSPNEKLERLIDELIGIIKIGQEHRKVKAFLLSVANTSEFGNRFLLTMGGACSGSSSISFTSC